MEFARFVTSSVPPVSEAQLTASLALLTKFSMRVDAGPLAPLFFSPALEPEAPLALATVLMDFTRYQPLSVLLARFNALLAMVDPATAHLAFRDQCPRMELAQSTAERTSSVSKEFALLALLPAMDAQ